MQRRFGEAVPVLDRREREKEEEEGEGLIDWIRENEIGADAVIDTPFGKRKLLYCDYSATARAIGPIEDYIRTEVLPLYGNTHSSVTVTAEQTTLFMHEARQEVRAWCGAGDAHSVLFTGQGSTAAVDLAVHLMGAKDSRPIVLHSAHEHHSNLLPWRELAERCICIPDDATGRIDRGELVAVLEKLRKEEGEGKGRMIVAALSACSNVTGIVERYEEVNAILKSFSAVSVWDFASAAPYVQLDVTAGGGMDVVFFSGHKWSGAVATPGVLVMRKQLMSATRPLRNGGGTVFFVSDAETVYLKEAEHREEGGTPDPVGCARLALAVKMRRAVGGMEERERRLAGRLLSSLCAIPSVHVLGPRLVSRRLPVAAFVVRDTQSGLLLHHNYVAALLNDLFGIQTRPGCVCAGPYAQWLLGIGEQRTAEYLAALREQEGLDRGHLRRVGEYGRHEMLRPGFTRISMAFFASAQQVDYVVEAVRFVAERGAEIMHMYQLNVESAEWHHHRQRTFHARKWMGDVEFGEGGMRVDREAEEARRRRKTSDVLLVGSAALTEARRLADESAEAMKTLDVPDGRLAFESDLAHLRWFLLAVEVVERTRGVSVTYPHPPFTPRQFEDVPEEERVEYKPVKTVEQENGEQEEEEKGQRVEEEEVVVEQCDPCGVGAGGAGGEEMQCPLDPADVGKGRMGDVEGGEAESSGVKETEDWNRRVVVVPREVTREEERELPWISPPMEIYRRMTEAVHGLGMIKDGDKVLVCLSGGKDSLAMLHILHHYQMRCRKNRSTRFDLGAMTVDPGSSAYDPRPLIDYCRQLNIHYFYEEQDIIGAARKLPNLRSICAFCSRMKRGRLAAAAQLHGWNVLAMGQHLDDLAESFLIAAFQNGNLSTMKAQYTTRDGLLRVIRPLVYVREQQLRSFADSSRLPVISENCPACFNQATERHRMKQLLAGQELIFPELFNSLRSALRPLLEVDSACTDEMRAAAIRNIVLSNKGKAK